MRSQFENRRPRVLSLRDRLSLLSLAQAKRALGDRGEELIQKGGALEIDIESQVRQSPDSFELDVLGATVTLNLGGQRVKPRLVWRCNRCETPCIHGGAAFSLILEEKTLLGLARPPSDHVPIESLSEEELISNALEGRLERAIQEKMRVQSSDAKSPWTDYVVTSQSTGKSYRVALRGLHRGDSYCTCPDFRANTLGTCKHIMHVASKIRKKFTRRAFLTPPIRKGVSVSLRYEEGTSLRVLGPTQANSKVEKILSRFKRGGVDDVPELIRRIHELERLGADVTIYPDAAQFIEGQLCKRRVDEFTRDLEGDFQNHRWRKNLLKVELLPYQLEGIAFAVKAGRAILADDMGLGKTIQGIGVAELLAQAINISRVLVVCPASLKSQWSHEIARFCARDAQLVLGRAEERARQYHGDCFFTICNYEQVLRDAQIIEEVPWDLIILDEAQRIKNWEAKTTAVIKSLQSTFALAMTGTPIENRIDELFSIAEFVDGSRLGAAFRFFNRYRLVNEKGRVLGYENLDELRDRVRPLLLRRTRESVMRQLPERTTEVIRIPPTEEQSSAHDEHKAVIAQIVRKPYISEMDLLRLQKCLLICRMLANSTYLLDKEPPGYSTKLDVLEDLLGRLLEEKDRKIVLFSEWTTMLDLIEERCLQGVDYVRLDGSVPQKKRQVLVSRFRDDPNCRVFLATNAGSTGLNLQVANTIVNVDLPWNPAVLEQRIGRAHRMGQRRAVLVYVLVTENTIESDLLSTLAKKHELAQAVLDPDSDVTQVHLESGIEELKKRLEVLLGEKKAPVDESLQKKREGEAQRYSQSQPIERAGGDLLSAAFGFLDAVLPSAQPSPQTEQLTQCVKEQLSKTVERDEEGRLKLTISLDGEAALDRMARTLSSLVASRLGGSSGDEEQGSAGS